MGLTIWRSPGYPAENLQPGVAPSPPFFSIGGPYKYADDMAPFEPYVEVDAEECPEWYEYAGERRSAGDIDGWAYTAEELLLCILAPQVMGLEEAPEHRWLQEPPTVTGLFPMKSLEFAPVDEEDIT